jgi:hypothetical protein
MSVLIQFTVVPNDSYIEYLHRVSFSLDLSVLFHSAHAVEISCLFDISVYVLDIFYWPSAFVVSGTMASSSASGFLADSETAIMYVCKGWAIKLAPAP